MQRAALIHQSPMSPSSALGLKIGFEKYIHGTSRKIPRNLFEFSYFFHELFCVFVYSWTRLDMFGHIQMHSDAFGCIQTLYVNFGKLQKFREKFRKNTEQIREFPVS